MAGVTPNQDHERVDRLRMNYINFCITQIFQVPIFWLEIRLWGWQPDSPSRLEIRMEFCPDKNRVPYNTLNE